MCEGGAGLGRTRVRMRGKGGGEGGKEVEGIEGIRTIKRWQEVHVGCTGVHRRRGQIKAYYGSS